ncbi:MAG TPA: hypothetical protein VHR66_30635 [Gemmataceae bacterium]|jgi:hypothetical protein|nr:hypothetical protein [Gemmataceae bacterium]
MQTRLPLPVRSFGQTKRPDNWWVVPILTFLGLSAFVVYSTWAAFQGKNYASGPYLSPFYSPVLFGDPDHAWFGPQPSWWPEWLVFSPALLILWAPAGFRFTCYYYRGAYYKAFWLDPPACTVGEPRKGYRGEQSLPLLLQNVHRYFMYIALIFIGLLAWDAIKGFWFTDPATGQGSFGIGVGSFVLVINVILLGGYTLGCHSFRHLVGGCMDEMSKAPLLQKAYNCSSCLNRKHMTWAWFSLFWVGFSDVYVRLCASGVWTDWRII